MVPYTLNNTVKYGVRTNHSAGISKHGAPNALAYVSRVPSGV